MNEVIEARRRQRPKRSKDQLVPGWTANLGPASCIARRMRSQACHIRFPWAARRTGFKFRCGPPINVTLETRCHRPWLLSIQGTTSEFEGWFMARKTFISYKFSEAEDLRDRVIEALGEDATYYQGETAESPDRTDAATETIKGHLTDMMYDTSVTIVLISPNMTQSKWIDWEIEYCLKETSRKGRTSKTNGVIGVVQEIDGEYDWLVSRSEKPDGCKPRTIDTSKLYPIIAHNRFNRTEEPYTCSSCQTYSRLDGSYFSIVDEEEFLVDPERYIENAFDKSESFDDFNLTKQR